MANKDERAYIDVVFFLNRRTSNSASSFISTKPFLIAGPAYDYRTPARLTTSDTTCRYVGIRSKAGVMSASTGAGQLNTTILQTHIGRQPCRDYPQIFVA